MQEKLAEIKADKGEKTIISFKNDNTNFNIFKDEAFPDIFTIPEEEEEERDEIHNWTYKEFSDAIIDAAIELSDNQENNFKSYLGSHFLKLLY